MVHLAVADPPEVSGAGLRGVTVDGQTGDVAEFQAKDHADDGGLGAPWARLCRELRGKTVAPINGYCRVIPASRFILSARPPFAPFVLIYLLFLVFTICLLDDSIPLDMRLLSPIAVPLIVATACLVHRTVWQTRGLRYAVTAACAILVAMQLASALLARPGRRGPESLVLDEGRQSETLAAVRDCRLMCCCLRTSPRLFTCLPGG